MLVIDWPIVELAAEHKPDVYGTDLYYGFRLFGAYPVWLIIGLALWLIDRADGSLSSKAVKERALAVVLSPMIAGLLAAVLKLLLRRERPDLEVMHYVFRPFSEHTFMGGGLGLPSSHSSIAFAGMITLARLCPSIRTLAITLAIGTGLQRIISGAHFPSDVYAGATVGYFSVVLTWALHRRFGTGSLLT